MKSFLFSVAFLYCNLILAQPTTFIKTYGNASNEVGEKIIEDFDRNFVIAGERGDSVLLLKVDSNGNQTFLKTFDVDSVQVKDIIQTYDSNYIILGNRIGSKFILKCDKQGNLLWLKQDSNQTSGEAFRIIETFDHSLWIAANVALPFGNNCCIGYYTKYDALGNYLATLWIPASYGRIYDLVQDKDSSIILPFSQIQGGPPKLGFQKIKSASNAIVWTKQFLGIIAEAVMMIPTQDKNFILDGAEYSGPPRLLLLKVDSAGNQIWHKGFKVLNTGANVISQNCDSGFLFCAFNNSWPDSLLSNIYLVYINSQGDSTGSKTFNFPLDDESRSMIKTHNNNFLITGFTTSFGNGDKDILLMKLDCNGNVLSTTDLLPVSGITVFPNPASTSFSVKSSVLPIKQVEVFSMLGKSLMRYCAENKEEKFFTLSTQNLSSGIYFLKINSGDKVEQRKLVIAK